MSYTVLICQYETIPPNAKNGLIYDYLFTKDSVCYHGLIYETKGLNIDEVKALFTGDDKVLKVYSSTEEDTLKPILFQPEFDTFDGLNELFSPFIFIYFTLKAGMLNSARTICVFNAVADFFNIPLIELNKGIHVVGLSSKHTEDDIRALISIAGVEKNITMIKLDSEHREALVFFENVDQVTKVLTKLSNCKFDGNLIRLMRLDGIKYVSEIKSTTSFIEGSLLL